MLPALPVLPVLLLLALPRPPGELRAQVRQLAQEQIDDVIEGEHKADIVSADMHRLVRLRESCSGPCTITQAYAGAALLRSRAAQEEIERVLQARAGARLRSLRALARALVRTPKGLQRLAEEEQASPGFTALLNATLKHLQVAAAGGDPR